MLKSIPIESLRTGMFLVEYGAGTFDRPLVRPNRLLESREEITQLVREGVTCVLIDLARSRSARQAGAVSPSTSADVSFADEIVVASKTYARALTVMHEVVEATRKGLTLDLTEPQGLAEDLTASLGRNSRAAVSLTTLKRRGYMHVHSVNTAVVAAAFALHLGCQGAQARTLVLAGFLHDLGMCRVSARILSKPGRLNASELTEVRKHPAEGLRLLQDCEGVSASLLKTMAEHHERFDGAGYPRGLSYEQLGQPSRILAIADTYAAMIAERPYRAALLPREALKRMYALKDREFYSEDLGQFIRCMGIFPVGSFVRLTDGRYAVVADVDPDKPLYPTVKVSFDHKMRSVRPEILNLALAADLGGPGIQDCLDPQECRVELSRILF